MTVEIVIPSLRQGPVERLAMSLAMQTEPPDIITIVSNETQPFDWAFSTPVRLLRFASEEYSIGELDVALRQDVGIYASECDVIVIQGDDQVAPLTMIEDTLEALEDGEYIWGNHRLINFDGQTLEEILSTDPRAARSRENPEPPARHGYQSCYGGMFAARTDFLQDFGGIDMMFNCRHAGEDQQLGYRLMAHRGEDNVLIVEPPFSWHPVELRDGDTRTHTPWLKPIVNGCGRGQHDLETRLIKERQFVGCRRCPYLAFEDRAKKLYCAEPVIRYRPDMVTTTSVWL